MVVAIGAAGAAVFAGSRYRSMPRGGRAALRPIVLPLLGSANRDASKFEDPDRFDIHRDTKGHISFGQDIHFCLGAALARLEAKVLLEVMLEELPAVRRREKEVAWVPSMIMRTPHHLELEPA